MSVITKSAVKAMAVLTGVVTFAGMGATQAVAAQADTAQAAKFRIPQNFLLYEAEFRNADKPWQKARFSDKRTAGRLLDPCYPKGRPDGRRVAARTISLEDEADRQHEQLIVYKNEREARKGWAALRADLAKCRKGGGKGQNRYEYRWKPVRIGDQALLAGGSFFEERVVYSAVRKGRAIALYARTGYWNSAFRAKDFRDVERDARKMARKVCTLPGVC